MRKRKLYVLTLCAIIFCSLFTGCGAGRTASLTEDQEAGIEMIIKWRDEWEEYVDLIDRVPANRLHIAEISTKDGKTTYTFMTVGYVKEGTRKGEEIFVAKGYLAKEDHFSSMSSVHKDWDSDCITVDLENMSDEELREILRECYINYLKKEK